MAASSPERLSVNLLGSAYDSPLAVASGTLVERFEQISPFLEAGAGAVIPRSTRKTMVRKVHPSPHLYVDGRGGNASMLNAEWTGADITYWRPYLAKAAELGKVIMSVSGRDIEGCREVCQELDEYGFPLLEINVSCGVSNGVHGYITRNAAHVTELCDTLKSAGIQTPFSLKLGHSDAIVEIAGVAKEAGADAITAINTIGPVFDFRIGPDGKPDRVMGAQGAKGGLSGKAIFHTALTDVAEIRRQIDIPVLASGGVMNAEQAVKMVMAGASLVQLYTQLHEKGIHATQVMTKANQDLLHYMDSHRIDKIADVKDAALGLLELPTELVPRKPIVDLAGCIGCDACVRVCLPSAFDKIPADNKAGHVVSVNDACIGCGHCISQCPVPDVLSLTPEY